MTSKKRPPRWLERGLRLPRSDEEKELDQPLDEDDTFLFKPGEKDFLDKVPTKLEVPEFDPKKSWKLQRTVAAQMGSKQRREVLASTLSEAEKKDKIFALYRLCSEDSGFHPTQLRIGPKNLHFIAELALEHGRSLNYVVDRIVEAARYNIPYLITADLVDSDKAKLRVQQRNYLESLAADLLREEILCQP